MKDTKVLIYDLNSTTSVEGSHIWASLCMRVCKEYSTHFFSPAVG